MTAEQIVNEQCRQSLANVQLLSTATGCVTNLRAVPYDWHRDPEIALDETAGVDCHVQADPDGIVRPLRVIAGGRS